MIYAGSPNPSNINELSHRLRITFGNSAYNSYSPGAYAWYPPISLACSSAGLFVADTFNHRILNIQDSGPVTVIAGTSQKGSSPEGTAAKTALLGGPFSLISGPEGSLYFWDTDSETVKRISADGKLYTVAGSHTAANTGGAPSQGIFLAIDSNSSLYFSNPVASTIAKLTKDGIISIVAGTGISGTSPDPSISKRREVISSTEHVDL